MIRKWTQADQVRKVKGFLRCELAQLRRIRTGEVVVPFTAYGAAVSRQADQVAVLRAALLREPGIVKVNW